MVLSACREARIVLKPLVCCTFAQPHARQHRATRPRDRLYTCVARMYDPGHENTPSPATGTVVQPAASLAGGEGERDHRRPHFCVVGGSFAFGTQPCSPVGEPWYGDEQNDIET